MARMAGQRGVYMQVVPPKGWVAGEPMEDETHD